MLRGNPEIGARFATLRRDIYVGIIWTLQTFRVLDTLEQHLGKARDQFPDDPMVRLAFGECRCTGATSPGL